ncbi:hypothetical protein QN224_32155 [Sinorhizobium sp. 8-89]|uniref:hypothetical protein n=1 Tax=Sinorhizobium sp. 7-81 TaxID=3049087 RepID=UPI0024C4474A|nr:hypothetical protein [Sinorhizobium sp. 7-81]MDK1389977.1 hypothetical protein [Sinorhizobium sp. 7-81]
MGKTGDVSLVREAVADNETFGEAMANVGFVPANVGRKIVSQGKRKEKLKKRLSTDPNK